MTISRGQMPRQLYGLGSLVKSVTKAAKGVVKGVKDVAKSPIGKAAMLYFAPMAFGQSAGLAGYKGLMGTKAGLGFKSFLGDTFIGAADPVELGRLGFGTSTLGKFLGSNVGKAAMLTIPSVLAAAGVQDEEEIAELQQDKEKLAVLLERGYKNLNLNASPEEVDAFVRANVAEGGRIGYAIGGDTAEDNAMQASGIMGLPLNENPAGVTELDLRETGGFIPPVGVKEKADDIPAMLSNNEFVFTADAVRGMGGGDVDKGAERMYAMMKTLENGGRV
jgi:hypothetical protein